MLTFKMYKCYNLKLAHGLFYSIFQPLFPLNASGVKMQHQAGCSIPTQTGASFFLFFNKYFYFSSPI